MRAIKFLNIEHNVYSDALLFVGVDCPLARTAACDSLGRVNKTSTDRTAIAAGVIARKNSLCFGVASRMAISSAIGPKGSPVTIASTFA